MSPDAKADNRSALEFLLARSPARLNAVRDSGWITQIVVSLISVALAFAVPELVPLIALLYVPALMWLCTHLRAVKEAAIFANLLEDGCWDEVRQTRVTMAGWVDAFLSWVVVRQLRESMFFLWLPVGTMVILVWLMLCPPTFGQDRWLWAHLNGVDWPLSLLMAVTTALVWISGLALIARATAITSLRTLLDERRVSTAERASLAPLLWLIAVGLVCAFIPPALVLMSFLLATSPVTLPLILLYRTVISRRDLIAELERSRWTEPQPRNAGPDTVDVEAQPSLATRVSLKPWSDNPLVIRDCIQESICRDGSVANWYTGHYWAAAVLSMLVLCSSQGFGAGPSMSAAGMDGVYFVVGPGSDPRFIWMPLFWIVLWALGCQVKNRLGQKLAREHFGRALEALRSTPFSSHQFIDGWAQIAFVPGLKQLAVISASALAVTAGVLVLGSSWAGTLAATVAAETLLVALLLMAGAYVYLQYLLAPCECPRIAEKARLGRIFYLLTCLLGPVLMVDFRSTALFLLIAFLVLKMTRRITIEWDQRGPSSL